MNAPLNNARPSAQNTSTLDVFLLGIVDLEASIELQDRLSREIAARNDVHGAVLICEHPLCVTIGDEGSFADVQPECHELVSRGLEVRWLQRSGGTFVHLPGQLSAYVIVPLERRVQDLAAFQTTLENSLVSLAADFKVTAESASKVDEEAVTQVAISTRKHPDSVPGAVCRCGQFAFIGTSERDGVSWGGMHVNVSLPQESLDLVRWADFDLRVTSLATQRARPTAMSTVRESLIRNLANALGYDNLNIYTGHPLLHRSIRKVYVYA